MRTLMISGITVAALAAISMIAVIVLSMALPAGFWLGAKDADGSYDDWSGKANLGDEITVSGRIAEETSVPLLIGFIFGYRFEGCEGVFISNEDLGDEGDLIVVTIERTEIADQAKSGYRWPAALAPNLCCGSGAFLLLITGSVLIATGILSRKRKTNEDGFEIVEE